MNEQTANTVTVELSGRIDSGNSAAVEEKIIDTLGKSDASAVVMDAEKLEYISSAGLRVLLRVKKQYDDFKIVNVNSEVYEILEMTGFTEMMTVEKAYRVVSVEGCEVIGEGANGKVYRIDKDNVVKTYKNADALSEIQHEREVARLALILGVPTAISYDVVKVGDSYGSVFELLNSRSFAKILATEPERMDWCVKEYVDMLKKIHSIKVPAGKLPSRKEKILKAATRTAEMLPGEYGKKLVDLIAAVPECDTMIHGDYHTKNIVLAGDEVLLIDMDTLAVAHPIFEFMGMYDSYIGFSEYDPEIVLKFQGFPEETANAFWHKTLAAYFGTEDEKTLTEIENKIRCVSYGYLIDWKNRHPSGDPAADAGAIALWKERLISLLPQVDTLCFETAEEQSDPDSIETEATVENLQKVTDFVNTRLEAVDCPMKALMQIDIAVEEIFVNVAHYAYAPDKGNVKVTVKITEDPARAAITFTDSGVPYNPLAKEDPDVTLSAEERKIGGLGIFMTKSIMDDVIYEYRDKNNIFTMIKNL